MQLTTTTQKFILHWGEMGSRWGVNRTVAQIHALLYVANKPLNAEDIAGTLGIARSNVSNSLKELQSWGLISVRHLLGDRRDHFLAEQDLWQVAQLVVEGRKKREIDPTLQILKSCIEESQNNPEENEDRARLEGLLQFIQTLDETFEMVKNIPPQTLISMAKLAKQMHAMAQPLPSKPET